MRNASTHVKHSIAVTEQVARDSTTDYLILVPLLVEGF